MDTVEFKKLENATQAQKDNNGNILINWVK